MIHDRACEHFGVCEEQLEWEDGAGHYQATLLKGYPGWFHMDALFRDASGYSLSRIELVRNRWLEVGCQSLLHQCESNAEDSQITVAEKQIVLDDLHSHIVIGGRASLIWAWYPCDPSVAKCIARKGFASLPVAARGVCGYEHYCHLDAGHACRHAAVYPAEDGHWCLMLVLVVLGTAGGATWCDDESRMHDGSGPSASQLHPFLLPHVGDMRTALASRREGERLIAIGPVEHRLLLDHCSQALPFAICWVQHSEGE